MQYAKQPLETQKRFCPYDEIVSSRAPAGYLIKNQINKRWITSTVSFNLSYVITYYNFVKSIQFENKESLSR